LDMQNPEELCLKAKSGEGQCPADACAVDVPEPFSLVIFGASGDLTKRKLIPSMYHLHKHGHLPKNFFILGTASAAMDDEGFRAHMKEAVKSALPDEYSDEGWEGFAKALYYRAEDFTKEGCYGILKEGLPPLEKKHDTGGNRIFYLAIPPQVYEPVIEQLGASGLSKEENGYAHIVIEKPFGSDLESSRRLNSVLKGSFRETQIYRMDHYLAKENVQNILMFRFANSIFEPLWNRRYIDHVQITISETLGVEHRAGYYDKAGVIRDMFQSHMLQLLALTAMEPPSLFEAERVRDEKTKVFRSIRPFMPGTLDGHVVVGQYGAGEVDGVRFPAYRDEPGVPEGSNTPTFAAMKLFIDNWRWSGVPFYLRSGKRMSKRSAEVAIKYKQVPHLMFRDVLQDRIEPNTLVLRVQPDEGIDLHFQAKMPDSKVCLTPVLMDFAYQRAVMLDAYERVLLDCMGKDQMLFVREDGEEETWALLAPVMESIEAGSAKPPHLYEAGTAGPEEADRLIGKDGRAWRPL